MTETPLFDGQTPLYSSAILGNYLNYLEHTASEVDIDELLRCSGLSRLDLNDEGHFLSQEQINAFHRCLDEKVTDPDVAYRVGQRALRMKSTGTVMQYGLQFITPQTMYRAVDRVYSKWSRGHLCKTTITGRSQAEITVSVRPGVHEAPFQCRNRQGILEAIAEVQTGYPAQIHHPQCLHRGDDACRYLVSWRNKPSTVWKRLGAGTGLLALLAAAGTPLFLSAAGWAITTLVLGAICLVLLLVGSRIERKELIASLKEQGDVADQLLKEIDARHQTASLVQEIGQASADILEVKTFLDTVLKSMARNLGFTRGVITLCEEGCHRLRYVAQYGFTGTDRQTLKQLDVQIDIDNSTDMFIQSLKSGRPLFLKNIDDQVAHMAPNSVNILKNLNIGTLISIPLIYKKEPLGLLFVDTAGSTREPTGSDVSLLKGIASQIATGIVNARSYTLMQESERRYRLLAENVMDVIWILDFASLKMTYVSPSVEKTQGYTPDELMSLSIDQYLTADSFERATTSLARALAWAEEGKIDPHSYSIILELEEVHKNGTLIPVEVTAGFLVDVDGKPTAVLGISRDLSERRRAERERTDIESRLQQAKKMESLGTMAGSIAHNFNNLLMVVLGNLELAKEDLPEPSTTTTNIQRAINASNRAADLSGMMLTYVGQLKKESVPVDLSQMVETVLGTMEESTMANVDLVLDLAAPMPLVAADAAQMRQVISGFVTNAIEALGNASGRVRISTGSMHCDRRYLSATYLNQEMPEGMYAYVEVADTGCGMDAETLAKVFDPFYSTKFTGRGLGMAAVMGIIRSHNGAIKVSSIKDEGSIFTALFPLQGIALGKSEPNPSRQTPPAAGKTVLLVDDEAMVMEVATQFLERLGYSVLTASNGQQALDILTRTNAPIECLLIDFTMPGMDGLETMRRVRKIRPEARIIIASGYTRQQIEDRFADSGLPDGFIHKPFEMKALKEKLERVIDTDHRPA